MPLSFSPSLFLNPIRPKQRDQEKLARGVKGSTLGKGLDQPTSEKLCLPGTKQKVIVDNRTRSNAQKEIAKRYSQFLMPEEEHSENTFGSKDVVLSQIPQEIIDQIIEELIHPFGQDPADAAGHMDQTQAEECLFPSTSHSYDYLSTFDDTEEQNDEYRRQTHKHQNPVSPDKAKRTNKQNASKNLRKSALVELPNMMKGVFKGLPKFKYLSCLEFA